MIASFIAGFMLCLLGAILYVRHMRAKLNQTPKIPKEWPLLPRLLLNSRERETWIWLSRAMYEQQVMVKLPVTRFTIPADRREAMHWYNLLNKVYFTFTVCNQEGRVLGCVDVPGSNGLSLSTQTLKFGLLSQCGIPYWVVEPDNLPKIQQIRAAFLGEGAAQMNERERLELRFKNVAGNLHAAVLRQRSSKQAAGGNDGRLPEGWEMNSFVAPLDSRTAGLNQGQ